MDFNELVLCASEKVAGFLGYNKGLKEHQRLIMLELMKKRDVFGILPTGYGNLYTTPVCLCFVMIFFMKSHPL